MYISCFLLKENELNHNFDANQAVDVTIGWTVKTGRLKVMITS